MKLKGYNEFKLNESMGDITPPEWVKMMKDQGREEEARQTETLFNLPRTETIKESKDGMVTLNVTISNVDKSTADDFLKMFAFMEWCGNVGTGRSMKAFFDGDGHFRPDIKVEGYKLEDIDLGMKDDSDGIDLDFGA